MHRWAKTVLFVGIVMVVAGCPRGRTDFNEGHKAQDLQDYDAAFEYYQKALNPIPGMPSIRSNSVRLGLMPVNCISRTG